MKKIYFLMVFLLVAAISKGQSAIVIDNFGTTAQNPISRTGWTANIASGSNWELRTTGTSTGYSWTNPSINSSGGANVFTNLGTNTNTKQLTYDNLLSTLSYTSIKVRFGGLRSGTVPDVNVLYSTDGSVYISAGTVTLSTAWAPYTVNLPAAAEGASNLRIRFEVQANNNSSNFFRIDDFHVVGTSIPTPTTTSISPSSATAGTGGFTLTVNGTNFVNGVSAIRWNGANKTTTFVSSTQLTAAIDAADIATAGSATVTVLNTGNPTESNGQTFTINPAAAPTRLVVTSVSPASPTVNSPFSVTVQSQDNSNIPQNAGSNVTVNLSRTAGTGTLGGTLSGTINAGTNSVTFTGLTYNVAESGVELTAADGASVLTSGTTTFTVQQAASQLAFVGVPASGTPGVNLSSFTVEARRPDNSVDNTYTGNITISKASGPGTVSGTTTVAAVAGVATFSTLQFDLAGTYTLNAASGSLTQAITGNISIVQASVNLGNYQFTGTSCSAGALSATGVAANLTYSSFAPTGITCNSNVANVFSGNASWGSVFSSTRYLEFTVTPATGYSLTISSLTFDYFRSAAGATNTSVRSNADNYAADILSPFSVGTGSTSGNIPLSGTGFTNLVAPITFRIYGWGGSSTGDFRVDNVTLNGYLLPAPTITSFTPTNGYTGSSIVITGTNFTGATSVTFGGTNASSFTVDNGTQITATVGAGSTGIISVTTPNGTGSSAGTFTYNGYISDITGNWNTGSSWLGGGVPPAGSNVTLKPGNTITMTANESVNDITIGTGATLGLNGNTLSVSGDYSNSGNLSTNSGTVDFVRASGTQTLTTGGTGAGKTFYDFLHSGNSTLSLATNNLQVMNNFTNDAGPFNSNGLNVTIRGNMSAAGTFTPGAGVLTFDGTANQNWSGAVANNYGGVVINKSSGDVVVGSNITVNNLTLTNGKAVLGSNNLLVSSAVTGGSAASYVQTNGTGTLTVSNITTSKSLPVGNAAYNQLLIENGSGHNWSVRVIDGLTSSPGYNTDRAVLLQWDITPSVNPPAGGADITFQFDQSTQVGPLFNTGTSVQAWRNPLDAGWVTAGTPTAVTVVNPTTATIKVTGLAGFSKYALSNVDGPLPVTLLSFSGYKDGSRNQLSWTTASELNNRGFEVQRSTDGVNYTAIGFVNSLANGGNSNDQLSYRFTDNTPAGVKQYYRLRQEDVDGRSKLSNIVLINGNKATGVMISGLFPNPANDMVNVLVSVPGRTQLTLLVTDVAGRILSQKAVSAETGSNTIQMNVGNFSSGTYMVRLVCADGCEATPSKFIKY